jgi:hypothetical protein
MLTQPIKNVAYAPFGLFPTYCFDRDKDSLRVSYDFGSQLIERNKVGTFQQRSVVVDQTTLQGSIQEVSAHLETLQSIEPNDSDVAPSADLEEAKPNEIMVAPGVMAGHKISGANPSFPESSRRNHVSGSVILRAQIGSDGHIHSLSGSLDSGCRFGNCCVGVSATVDLQTLSAEWSASRCGYADHR